MANPDNYKTIDEYIRLYPISAQEKMIELRTLIQSIATATDTDYLKCRREMNRKKRELGYSSSKDAKFLYDYLKGYPRLIFKPVKGEPRIKGSDFCELHPEGTYILKMAGHITACIDGVMLDTWDCSYRSVYTAWEIAK